MTLMWSRLSVKHWPHSHSSWTRSSSDMSSRGGSQYTVQSRLQQLLQIPYSTYTINQSFTCSGPDLDSEVALLLAVTAAHISKHSGTQETNLSHLLQLCNKAYSYALV
jgi:hypothetical protein